MTLDTYICLNLYPKICVSSIGWDILWVFCDSGNSQKTGLDLLCNMLWVCQADTFFPWNCRAKDENALEVDFGAMDFSMPHLTLSSSIGNGLHFVSKFLTSNLNGGSGSKGAQHLVDYLLSLHHHGEVWEQLFFFSSKFIVGVVKIVRVDTFRAEINTYW